MRDLPATSLDLAALTASRICHDLTSPLGAVGNGLELLELAGMPADAELALVAQAASLARARLRFLRLAYGAAPHGQTIAAAEIASTLADRDPAARLRVDWQANGAADRAEVKLAFLLLQCLESAMPYGGTVTVTRAGESWRLTGHASRLRDLAAYWTGLEDGAQSADITPSLLHFALAPHAAQALSRRIAVEIGADTITLAF